MPRLFAGRRASHSRSAYLNNDRAEEGAAEAAIEIPANSRVHPMKTMFTVLTISALLFGCAWRPAEVPVSLLGQPIPPAAAQKTIVIRPDTRWVNVTGGDTVRFLVGDKAFGWGFDVAAGVKAVDLERVAPPGMLDHPVVAYVAPDPRYIGGRNGKSRNR
jgi:Heavy-metal resistance protein CzcE